MGIQELVDPDISTELNRPITDNNPHVTPITAFAAPAGDYAHISYNKLPNLRPMRAAGCSPSTESTRHADYSVRGPRR